MLASQRNIGGVLVTPPRRSDVLLIKRKRFKNISEMLFVRYSFGNKALEVGMC
jgi:hypothetical protein